MLELTVLFATDFQGDVQGGLHLATRLARERAATLVILHVVPIDSSRGEANLYEAMNLMSDRSRYTLERLLPTDQGVAYRHALEVGEPEQRIAEFAQRDRAELLVMEVRKRSALDRFLRRSLVERLAERAHCPIVTYHAGTVARAPETQPRAAANPQSSREVLASILDARVHALVTWMNTQREAVREIAAQSTIADAIATLCHASQERVFQAATRRKLELELLEHQRALGALGVQVMSRGELVLQLGAAAQCGPAYTDFLDHLQREAAAVSVPLDEASSAEARHGLVLAGAQVAADAYLVFALDARRDFLRILAQPLPGPTAETYAFDARGMMLSNSRFPEQLRRLGLLPAEPGVQTALRLRVCDPGCDPHPAAGEALPLTRMAAAATAGEDGCDWTGYRDYRGVEVIGAWRWLAHYGFGVAAEMDRSLA